MAVEVCWGCFRFRAIGVLSTVGRSITTASLRRVLGRNLPTVIHTKSAANVAMLAADVASLLPMRQALQPIRQPLRPINQSHRCRSCDSHIAAVCCLVDLSRAQPQSKCHHLIQKKTEASSSNTWLLHPNAVRPWLRRPSEQLRHWMEVSADFANRLAEQQPAVRVQGAAVWQAAGSSLTLSHEVCLGAVC